MLKIGVFGTGHLGKFHLNNWKEIPGTEVIGFFDPNDEIAEAVSRQYDIKRFLNESELIEASDAIDVVAPTDTHFNICKQAIRKTSKYSIIFEKFAQGKLPALFEDNP